LVSGSYNFIYTELVLGSAPYGNPRANIRAGELNTAWTPTIYTDGGYMLYIGATNVYNGIRNMIGYAGSRPAADLDLIARLDHVESDVFHITVRIGNGVAANDGPADPQVDAGPHSGINGVSYDFESATTDPDADELYYRWDWGDGSPVTDWIGPYASGATCTASHSWNEGDFDIMVQAKDDWGVETAWSTAYSIHLQCCVVRGNIDNDSLGEITIADLVYLVDYMFNQGPPAPCEQAADLEVDGEIAIGDLVYLVDYMFNDGPEPPSCLP